MVYIYGALISLQIILGQVLWKVGVEKTELILSKKFIFSQNFLHFLFSPYIILGALSYIAATLLFMAMLSKFEYTNLQAVVVSTSLMFTFLAAITIFHEKVTILNFLGLGLLLLGVILVTKF